MKTRIDERLLKQFNSLMFPIALLWSLSMVGNAYLPSHTLESFENQFEPFFEIFHLGQKFGLSNSMEGTSHSKTVATTTLVPDPHRIKAIYRSSSDSFVTISDATTTTMVRLGGMYKKVFRLVSLSDTTATFSGYGKVFHLRLGHDDPLARQETLMREISDPAQSGWEEGEWHTITYSSFKNQISDLRNIENNVDATEVYNGDKIIGFRVDSITPESVYAQLGIQNGDIVLSVNNKKLDSYATALVLYTQIQSMKNIRLTLQRNNLPKEIVYEIAR